MSISLQALKLHHVGIIVPILDMRKLRCREIIYPVADPGGWPRLGSAEASKERSRWAGPHRTSPHLLRGFQPQDNWMSYRQGVGEQSSRRKSEELMMNRVLSRGDTRSPGKGHVLASAPLGVRPRDHQGMCGENRGPGWRATHA